MTVTRVRFHVEFSYRTRDACADFLALRLTSLHPVLRHFRVCRNARCAFGLLPFFGTPVLMGPLKVISEPRVRPSSVSPDEGKNGVGQRHRVVCRALLAGSGSPRSLEFCGCGPASSFSQPRLTRFRSRARRTVSPLPSAAYRGRSRCRRALPPLHCAMEEEEATAPPSPGVAAGGSYRRGFEFAGAGAHVRTVSVMPLVVSNVRNG
ncbi:hypothetical protein Taro_012177 [Colocasia esculenta]|uniref:Uncharacterized protein n=1 Tax=Colocasia esculenta TaxID=4460 RepID=A0A843UC76_COLES|nr:hypothetical protein [Colocasia esculenta]